jgi:hypothetical protein
MSRRSANGSAGAGSTGKDVGRAVESGAAHDAIKIDQALDLAHHPARGPMSTTPLSCDRLPYFKAFTAPTHPLFHIGRCRAAGHDHVELPANDRGLDLNHGHHNGPDSGHLALA